MRKEALRIGDGECHLEIAAVRLESKRSRRAIHGGASKLPALLKQPEQLAHERFVGGERLANRDHVVERPRPMLLFPGAPRGIRIRRNRREHRV